MCVFFASKINVFFLLFREIYFTYRFSFGYCGAETMVKAGQKNNSHTRSDLNNKIEGVDEYKLSHIIYTFLLFRLSLFSLATKTSLSFFLLLITFCIARLYLYNVLNFFCSCVSLFFMVVNINTPLVFLLQRNWNGEHIRKKKCMNWYALKKINKNAVFIYLEKENTRDVLCQELGKIRSFIRSHSLLIKHS